LPTSTTTKKKKKTKKKYAPINDNINFQRNSFRDHGKRIKKKKEEKKRKTKQKTKKTAQYAMIRAQDSTRQLFQVRHAALFYSAQRTARSFYFSRLFKTRETRL
jgi:hypothetical protein